jgi:hypothetical protein
MIVEASIVGIFKTVLLILGAFVLLRFLGQLMIAKRNMEEERMLNKKQRDVELTCSSKIIAAIFLNLPHLPENYNHPEYGRQTYIHGLAYEYAQLRKCASTVIQEIINGYANDDNVINVKDLLLLIEELK